MELDDHWFYEHLDEIIDNTYQVLVRNKEIEDILEDDDRVHMFLFDPYNGFKSDDHKEDIYTILIEHYEELELYERCQRLFNERKLLEKEWNLETIKRE